MTQSMRCASASSILDDPDHLTLCPFFNVVRSSLTLSGVTFTAYALYLVESGFVVIVEL